MLARKDRNSLLLSNSEHWVHLARIAGADQGKVVIDRLTELPSNNEESIASWIRESFPDRSGYLPAYCSFFPPDRLLMREPVTTRRLAEPGYLPTLVAEHAKVPSAKEWHAELLNPSDGMPLTPESTQRIGLVLGVPWAGIREIQARLKQLWVRPRSLELGTLLKFGGIARHMGMTAYPDGVAICEISRLQTRLYLIGKDGVHTPPALPHGLLSVQEAAMKELGAPDIATATSELESPTESLLAHGRRLVRMLSRHLRPAIDYFEMQTGQRIGSLHCGYLPAGLSWLEEALTKAVDLDPFVIDFPAWLEAVKIQVAGDSQPPTASWISTLSAVAQLAPATAAAATASPVASIESAPPTTATPEPGEPGNG